MRRKIEVDLPANAELVGIVDILAGRGVGSEPVPVLVAERDPRLDAVGQRPRDRTLDDEVEIVAANG